MTLTAKQTEALQHIAAGNGIVGVNAPNGHICNNLHRKGLIEGEGWPGVPYVLTAEGRKAIP